MLPKSQANQTLSKQPVTLTVTEDKHYYINQQEVPFEQLEQKILAEVAGLAEATVVIRLPHNLQIQDLIDVMQIGAKHKIKMVLATEKKS
jgi:biopolymer transport protein ExbD